VLRATPQCKLPAEARRHATSDSPTWLPTPRPTPTPGPVRGSRVDSSPRCHRQQPVHAGAFPPTAADSEPASSAKGPQQTAACAHAAQLGAAALPIHPLKPCTARQPLPCCITVQRCDSSCCRPQPSATACFTGVLHSSQRQRGFLCAHTRREPALACTRSTLTQCVECPGIAPCRRCRAAQEQQQHSSTRGVSAERRSSSRFLR
jgi:hypothetical protein